MTHRWHARAHAATPALGPLGLGLTARTTSLHHHLTRAGRGRWPPAWHVLTHTRQQSSGQARPASTQTRQRPHRLVLALVITTTLAQRGPARSMPCYTDGLVVKDDTAAAHDSSICTMQLMNHPDFNLETRHTHRRCKREVSPRRRPATCWTSTCSTRRRQPAARPPGALDHSKNCRQA